ncbi:MAG: hypothetical protein ACLUAR_13870 [Pilosibacter sp.]
MGRKTSVFALIFARFTDDIGFWTDENRKFRGLADEKSTGPLFIYARFYKQNRRMTGDIRFLRSE